MKKLIGGYDTSGEEAKGHHDAKAPSGANRSSKTLVSPQDLSKGEKDNHDNGRK